MTLDKKIRVCIRGMAGLLGSRLALALHAQEDMEVVAGIVKADASLEKILDPEWPVEATPPHLFLDGTKKQVAELNARQNHVRLQHANGLDGYALDRMCDVIVDCTPPGKSRQWNRQYNHFNGPVLLQSGEYPRGRLLAPPAMQAQRSDEPENMYRLGGCILAALGPVLSTLRGVAQGYSVTVVMQYDERVNDFPTNDRMMSMYLRDDHEETLQDELGVLFPEKNPYVAGFLQVPQHDYYTLFVHFDSVNPLSGKDVKCLLEASPRILVLPAHYSSTYNLKYHLRESAQALGKAVSPITVYSKTDLESDVVTMRHRVRIGIYSKLVAVLPNIDAIRMLATGMSPEEAMRKTDEYAGLKQEKTINMSAHHHLA